MKRKREIRGYSRNLGIERSRPSKLRTGALGLLLFAAVIGICGLATLASEQTDRLVASATSQKTTEPNDTISTSTNGFSGTPATLMQPLPVPGATTAAHKPRPAAPYVRCNTTQRTAAITRRSSQLQLELSRHQHVLWSIQTTGLVTKFLNPNMYNGKLDQEKTYHNSKNSQIQHAYQVALVRAHCKN